MGTDPDSRDIALQGQETLSLANNDELPSDSQNKSTEGTVSTSPFSHEANKAQKATDAKISSSRTRNIDLTKGKKGNKEITAVGPTLGVSDNTASSSESGPPPVLSPSAHNYDTRSSTSPFA